jgi:hypothetical protein
MTSKEEPALLKDHLEELSPCILRQLVKVIVAQKKKAAAEASAKSQRSNHKPGSAREKTPVSQQKPKSTAGKSKSTD